MSRRKSERSSRTRSRVPLGILPSIPSLIVKGGVAYLKFKNVRRKGVKNFKKQLKESGMTKEQIAELTNQYEDIGRIRSYLDEFGFLGGFF
jgi:hypothetical protein